MNRGSGIATLRAWGQKLVAPIDGPLLLVAGLLVLLAVGFHLPLRFCSAEDWPRPTSEVCLTAS